MGRFLLYIRGKENFILVLLIFLAILIRTAYVIHIYKTVGTDNWNDDRYYIFFGEQIASGNWYPNYEAEKYMRVAPWISLIIASFLKIFGTPVVPFYTYNIILSGLLVFVLYRLGKELIGGETGFILAFWGCFNVEFIRYTPHILKEPTLYLIVPLILYLIILHLKRNNYCFFLLHHKHQSL